MSRLRIKPHHRFVLTELLCQIDSLDDTIARFDAQIQAIYGPFEEAAGLLDTIPGGGSPHGRTARGRDRYGHEALPHG
jgi:hypothetical protein